MGVIFGGFAFFAFFPRLADFNLADGSQVYIHVSMCGEIYFDGIYFGGSLIHPPFCQIYFPTNTVYVEFFTLLLI